MEYGLEVLKEELQCASEAIHYTKDILIIVHDQLDFVKICIDSIQRNTQNYNIFLWDNGSYPPTADYLKELADTHGNIFLHREEENIGFIEPNNRLAEMTASPYIVLLNSDTKVYSGWDLAMTGWLQKHPEVAQVGYHGGWLNSQGKGVRFGFGGDVQYICGYCFCIPRATYEEFGLFDETNLEFAYFEDSDYSLRLQEAGKKIYALNVRLVHHFENRTVKQVIKEKDISPYLSKNSLYIQSRWRDQLNG